MKKIIFLSALLVCSGISLTILLCTAFIISWVCQGATFVQILIDMGWLYIIIPAISFFVSLFFIIKELLKSQ